MPVQLTPRGTRGAGFPKMAPWMVAVLNAGSTGFYRLLGRRIRMQGQPLLLLTTLGAKTGKRRTSREGRTMRPSMSEGSISRWSRSRFMAPSASALGGGSLLSRRATASTRCRPIARSRS